MKILSSFILILISANCFSSINDTTIFNNEYEKLVFQKIFDSIDVKPIDLYMVVNSASNPQEVEVLLNNYIQQINNSFFEKMRKKRKLSFVYKSAHEKFLRNYKEESYFGDIFKTGEYNCVSATALYSLILNELNLHYIIKETPNHVYLIAEPNSINYFFETTLPNNGLIQYDAKAQKDFVEYLHKNKIISDYDFANKTVNQLFLENYSKDISIGIRELAGIQYYNKGIFQYNAENYEEALKSFEKANILYSSNAIKYMFSHTLAMELNRELQNKDYNPLILMKYLDENKNDPATIQQVEAFFSDISTEMIVNNSWIDKYVAYFSVFKHFNLESDFSNKVHQIYYSHVSFYYYSNYEYYRALSILDKSYNINPNNLDTKRLISDISIRYLIEDLDHESRIDSVELYINKFPFLKQNKSLSSYYQYCLSRTVAKWCEDSEIEKGSYFLIKLEEFLKDNQSTSINEEYIGLAFGQIAGYYIRNQQYTLAENTLKRGLSFAPNSQELKGRLKTLQDYNGGNNNYRNCNNQPSAEYSNALKTVNKLKTEINRNAEIYLKQKWISMNYIEDGEIISMSKDEELFFSLVKEKELEISMFGEVVEGTWMYNKNDCTLRFFLEDSLGTLNIIILSINAGTFRGVMYFDKDTCDSYEITFASII